jgi:hypothetical protein
MYLSGLRPAVRCPIAHRTHPPALRACNGIFRDSSSRYSQLQAHGCNMGSGRQGRRANACAHLLPAACSNGARGGPSLLLLRTQHKLQFTDMHSPLVAACCMGSDVRNAQLRCVAAPAHPHPLPPVLQTAAALLSSHSMWTGRLSAATAWRPTACTKRRSAQVRRGGAGQGRAAGSGRRNHAWDRQFLHDALARMLGTPTLLTHSRFQEGVWDRHPYRRHRAPRRHRPADCGQSHDASRHPQGQGLAAGVNA